MRIFNWIW